MAAAAAAVLVTVGYLLGWRGVDTAAQSYRIAAFRSSGFQLWDFRWYGGHWTLDYSVLFPALAATLGPLTVTAASAAAATFAFDRLAGDHLDRAGRPAVWLFAAGTLVPAVIGQLPFLVGAGFGLPALWCLDRRRHPAALALALLCTLVSPLSGAFLALGAAAWGLDRLLAGDRGWPWAAAVGAAAGVPIVALAALFPGEGPMPYPVTDWLWEMVVAAAIAALAGRRHRPLTIGCGLFAVTATVSVCVPSALGGNVGRIEDLLALPLGAGLAWTRKALLVPLAAVPLALSQWAPAWGAVTSAPRLPSTRASFYAPLDHRLEAEGGPPGRVEVVPTEYHWEAAWVAPTMPLARGWERQLDEARNPLFYGARLDPATYRAWLLDNGVRFVALPSAPLDMAGRAEARLVASGTVPGLPLVWRSPEWRLYAVEGSPGIVSGPARLVGTGGGRVVLDVQRAAPVTVRIRWSPDWYVAGGAGCVRRLGSWLVVDPTRTGRVSLLMELLDPGRTGCPSPTAGGAARS
jgi:hypothetical protein